MNGSFADGGNSGQSWQTKRRRLPISNAGNVMLKGQGGDVRHVLVGECFVDNAANRNTNIFLFIELKDGMENIFTWEHCGRWE